MNPKNVVSKITLGWYWVACPAALILLYEFCAALLLHFHSSLSQRLFPYLNLSKTGEFRYFKLWK